MNGRRYRNRYRLNSQLTLDCSMRIMYGVYVDRVAEANLVNNLVMHVAREEYAGRIAAINHEYKTITIREG